jgi:UDP:flavonoid glycosyltransferase YjiC (YdhE family)
VRVLFTIHPGTGHLHPMVPVARALEAAGHEVAAATSASFVPMVEAAGLRAFAAGLDWLQSDSDSAMPGFMEADGPGQIVRLAQLATRGMVDDLVTIAGQWWPDVILRDATEYAGWVAAERVGIPHAAYAVGLRLPGPILRMWTRDTLATLPRIHGLDADSDLSRMTSYLYLNFVPESFEMAPREVLRYVLKSMAVDGVTPASYAQAISRIALGPKVLRASQRLRPVLFDRSGSEDLPPWLADLAPQPTVYASLGTVFNRVPRVLDAIVAAFRDEPANLILTVGRDGDVERFGPQPPNIRVERYIPQSGLLPRCDAVITHGGYGSVMAALGHGLPLVCLPMSADQPIIAGRAVALGAGLSCANASSRTSPFPYVEPSRLSPDAVRGAVRRVLREDGFRTAAHRLRAEIEALPGVEAAVESLERLVATRSPLVFA